MILRDTVEVISREIVDEDRYGNPIYGDVVVGAFPADVRVVSTAINTEVGRTTFVTKLRAILPPLEAIATASTIRWRGDDYNPDGDAEANVRGGRLHHYSIPLKRATG